MDGGEFQLLRDAFESNWIAPLGPHVDAFEKEFSEVVEVPHAAALSSGTGGLHLALLLLGVGEGDEVLCSDLTFAATAFAITYVGAKPVFIDCDRTTWNMDPTLLEEALDCGARKGKLPKAVIVVDLYGQSADWDPILAACERYDVPVIEDAAEALGATYKGRPVGGFGRFGVFSFNGNKIITTSGGGMLVSDDSGSIERARFLATQARDPAPHYQHSTIGFNYRMSNLLAAVGRGQLRVLDGRVDARRRVFDRYVEGIGDLPGVEFMPEAMFGRSNRWLTCLTIDPQASGVTREDVRLALEQQDIESRPVWKPMHLQPVFEGFQLVGGSESGMLFDHGLCLPSGSSLKRDDQDRVVEIMRLVF
jgi:dTDP-4-amino-4,6-dideoxygalactose transaminase